MSSNNQIPNSPGYGNTPVNSSVQNMATMEIIDSNLNNTTIGSTIGSTPNSQIQITPTYSQGSSFNGQQQYRQQYGEQKNNSIAQEHLRRVLEMRQQTQPNQEQPIQEDDSFQIILNTPQPPIIQPTPQPSGPKRAELKGRVRRLNPRNRNIFWVYTEKLQKEFKCRADFFCPVREGDALYGIVEYNDLNNPHEELVFIQPPFVEIGMDKDSVSRTFMKFLRGTGFGNTKAYNLYEVFLSLARNSEQYISDQSSPVNIKTDYNTEGMVCNYISELSEQWTSTEDEALLLSLNSVITSDQAKKLLGQWYKQCNLRRLYLLGLNNKEIRACHDSHTKIYEKCINNPFTVVELPIDKCYGIFARLGKVYTPDQERCALISRRLHDNTVGKSWTGTPTRIISSNFQDCGQRMPDLKQDYGVIGELFTLYLPYQHKVETTVSQKIMEWISRSPIPDPYDPNFLKKTLDSSQQDAISGALNNAISVITGPGGSGKTTVIGEVVHNLELQEIPYMVASFTGKAVARIREVIKRRTPATLHRLIAKASQVPPFKYLIIDEASMVTTDLFFEFGEKFKWDFRVLLVGDINQLPPIGWGNLFSQLMSSGLVPTYRLNINHRSDTGGTNGIVLNAEGIIRYRESVKSQGNPEEDDFDMESGGPFSFTPAPNFSMLEGNIENVFDIVRAMYQRRVESSKLTIITPYNKDLQQLNSTYQQIYNDGKPHITDCKNNLWMVGDRVMMRENNYDINVMNGEEGIIRDILDDGKDQEDPKIVVEFEDGAHHKFKTIYKDDDTEVDADVYKPKKDLLTKHLQLSFAVTVHKSQGSEWDFVIIYIPPCHSTINSFLNANLVYTSITRARRAIWMVGDITSYNSASVISLPYRCDNLTQRLKRINDASLVSENADSENAESENAESENTSETTTLNTPL